MDIARFMQGYKAAWEARDKAMFAALFQPDGIYHNTPFASQRGHAELAAYWSRVELQSDVQLRYEVLASLPDAGLAHWHVTYQVTSEELFRIWAASTGTSVPARQPGEPWLSRSCVSGRASASCLTLLSRYAGSRSRET